MIQQIQAISTHFILLGNVLLPFAAAFDLINLNILKIRSLWVRIIIFLVTGILLSILSMFMTVLLFWGGFGYSKMNSNVIEKLRYLVPISAFLGLSLCLMKRRVHGFILLTATELFLYILVTAYGINREY